MGWISLILAEIGNITYDIDELLSQLPNSPNLDYWANIPIILIDVQRTLGTIDLHPYQIFSRDRIQNRKHHRVGILIAGFGGKNVTHRIVRRPLVQKQ